ncbi:DUF11 domain-containing protein [Paenibacillus sp. DLE-14]|uniref:DUF11 domain-containing protein n=1 Tax=Paenibacillus lignilyticus TaxID=1172615 RepID=A0ABS5CGQ3_9BACL|nr:hypothetical protein [Paenibacillus lignilyticus]
MDFFHQDEGIALYKIVWVGSVFEYHITVTNNSRSITLEIVMIYDILDASLQFISGSLQVNGVPQLDPKGTSFHGV